MEKTYGKKLEEWLGDRDMYLTHKAIPLENDEIGVMVIIHHKDTKEGFLESFDKVDINFANFNTYDKVVEMICENLLMNKKTILEYRDQCNISF